MRRILRNAAALAIAAAFLSPVSSYSQDNLVKANDAYMDLRIDDAAKVLSTWETQLKKKRKAIPAELSEMRSKVTRAQNMLERVEKITIIDSIVVDKADFFTHYKLSPEAGKLFDASILPREYSEEAPIVVFKPQCRGEVFWGMLGEDGVTSIVSAQILDDGTFMQPTALGDVLNEGGDADYFYMMADGLTFYFANNGENSLGGYDIFMSRRNGDGTVYQPQNVGFPYNSPYDDYLLVIDEQAGLGWWATDRNQIPDSVTIYVFIPNETRVNYDPEDENLEEYAKITSIAATQNGDVDVDRLLNNPALQEQTDNKLAAEDTFLFSLGNGKVYTTLSDFRNSQARSMMRQYQDKLKDLDLMKGQLDALRRQYAKGDRTVKEQILTLEKRVNAAYPALQRLRNQVINLEK